MDLKRKGKIWKKTWLPALLSSLLFAFTHCLFGPIDLFFPNEMDFHIELAKIVPVFLICFAACLIVLEVLITLAALFPKKVYLACIGALFAAGLASWIQGNLLNSGMDLLEGGEPVWNKGSMILNAAIWIVLIAAFVFLAVKKGTLTMKIITYAAALLLIMECGSLAVSLVNHGRKPVENNEFSDRGKTTAKDTFTFSTQGDIYVFLLDSLDTRHIDQMLEENPEYVNFLPGAVYYRNTSTCYNRTRPSTVNMLTTKITRNEKPYLEFCDEAFAESPLFPTLQEKGYTIQIYGEPDNMFTTDMAGTVIDNLAVERYEIRSVTGFLKAYMRLTEYRYAPEILKPLVYAEFSERINAECYNPNAAEGDSYHAVGTFYNHYISEGFEFDDSRKFFKFFQTSGAHTPYTLDRDGINHKSGEIDQYEAALGAMLFVRTVMEDVMAYGNYDDTTVIILGDHGAREGDGVNNPAMIVRMPKSTGEMTTSMAPVQLLDVPATVLAAAGADPHTMGKPVWEWEGTEHRERFMYTYKWTKMTSRDFYLEKLTEYRVPDDATKLEEYELTGEVY